MNTFLLAHLNFYVRHFIARLLITRRFCSIALFGRRRKIAFEKLELNANKNVVTGINLTNLIQTLLQFFAMV